MKLFVGSSVSGLGYAKAVQKNLNYDAWVRVWPQGIFKTSSYPVDDLIAALDDADFGAFIFLPEDVLIINGRHEAETMAVRDNVLFELGMFIGRLGRDRAFMVKPRGNELHLPSDLAGVNVSDFNDDPNIYSALGPATDDILSRMKQAGPKAPSGAPAQPSSTPGYDRAQALDQAVSRSKPLIEGQKFIQSDVILASGDVRSSERLEGGQAIGDQPVAGIPMTLHSSAGRLAPPRVESLTEGQSVTLTWKDAKAHDETWEGSMNFLPPLTKNHPVTIKRERYMANGVSFTQRERMDVTNQLESEEEISVSFGQLYKEYLYQLVFPDGRFPRRFRLDVSLNNVRDDRESSFAERYLTELPATNTLLLDLPQPLPGYIYAVKWELPEEQMDGQFTRVQSGFVEEMTRRLLGLRTVNQTHTQAVRDALLQTRKRLLPGEPAAEVVEVSLYVYDRQLSSLVCVASLDAEIIEKQWTSYQFKPGRGVVGWAFRQRKLEKYCPAKASQRDEPERYEPITEDDRINPPQAVVSVPLFYSGNLARSVAVLCLATRSPGSGLIALACDASLLDKLAAELNSWYESQLAEALGVIASAAFWRL